MIKAKEIKNKTILKISKGTQTYQIEYRKVQDKHLISCKLYHHTKWRIIKDSKKEVVKELNKKINEYGYESFEIHNNY